MGKGNFLAAKSGVPDPEMNQKLKKSNRACKKDQCPADVIKRAIAKAAGVASALLKKNHMKRYGPGQCSNDC